MFEFGDELIIDSYRIPWLIWIQLLAMFLLVILIYYFTTTTPSDLSIHFSTATASASASLSPTALPYANPSFITSAAANTKVREQEIKETVPSASAAVQRVKKPDVRQREGSSTMNDGNTMTFEHSHHPCNFFGFAKQAFLKCLGIDSASENSALRRHEKDD